MFCHKIIVSLSEKARSAGHMLSATMLVIVALASSLHDMLCRRYALDENGKLIIRKTSAGQTFILKEPGLLRECMGIVIGGTICRDAKGYPLTDEKGLYIRDSSLFRRIFAKKSDK